MDTGDKIELDWELCRQLGLPWLQSLLTVEDFQRFEHDDADRPPDDERADQSDYEDDDVYCFVAPSGWEYLPSLILEKIYLLLSYKERHVCSQVCGPWRRVFYSPRLWKTLTVTPHSFTYRRLNRYTGEEKEVSKYKVHMCLQQVGRNFRQISILPNSNFHNMSKVMQIIGRFLGEFKHVYPLESLQEFNFDFACETKALWSHDTVIIGTGGGLLREMNFVLANLRNIVHLSFNNLCLNSQDAVGFLDDFVLNNRDTLSYLEVLNCTRHQYPLLNAGYFPHLVTLVISPLHVNDSVLLLLAEHTALRHLVLVQDRYTAPCEAASAQAWTEVKLLAPALRVRLELNGRTASELLLQPMAPVAQVMFDCPATEFTAQVLLQVADEYRAHLEVFGNKRAHRRFRSRRFHDRADTSLVLLARECPALHTLVIAERVSTATLLILASETHKLRHLYVRRNAVILKSDWLKAMAWSDAHFDWLCKSARSYDLVEQEISRIFGRPWKMLSDAEFNDLMKAKGRQI